MPRSLAPLAVLAGEAVLAAALFILLGWPAVATVRAAIDSGGPPAEARGLTLSLSPNGLSADVPRPLRLALESTRVVLATEVGALGIGVPLALVLFRTDVRGRRLALGILALSAFIPLSIHATAWLGAFGNAGRARLLGVRPFLVGWPGVAFVHATFAVPWVVLIAGAGFRTAEPELEENALLDLPAWKVALRVTLRRGLGAVAAAAAAVAVLTAGEMTVTDLLQVRTYAEEAYNQSQLGNGPGAMAAVALPPLVLLGGMLVLGVRALTRLDPARLASSASRSPTWGLGRWRGPVSALTVLVLVGLAGLPLWSVVWHAGRVGGSAGAGLAPVWSLGGFFGTMSRAWADAGEALMTSARLAAVGATLGVALAWSLAWTSREPGRWRWLSVFAVALALATPGPVAGMALMFAYLPFGRAYDSGSLIVVAYVLKTFPYALLILWPAVRVIPRECLDAASVDGLGPFATARRVGLPMTRGATVAAWAVSFALALGELPATYLVSPAGRTPLSVVVWGMLHTGVESRLAGLIMIMLLAIATAGAFAAFALRRLVRDPDVSRSR